MNDAERLIRAYYAAFQADDHEGMCAMLTEDFVHDVNQGTRRHGVEAFRDFLAQMDATYDEKIEELVVMTDPSGRRAAAEFIVVGQYLVTDLGMPEARGQRYRLPGRRLLRDPRRQDRPRHHHLQPARLDRAGLGLRERSGMDQAAFEAGLRQDGFAEVFTRRMEAGQECTSTPTPSTPASTSWRASTCWSRAARRAASFPASSSRCPAGVEHAESFGPHGASFIVGRRAKG
jgi:steroid delta-isomerase-like uncharacterized protein